MGSLILFENEFVHIESTDDGTVLREVGPKRIVLRGNQRVIGNKKNATVVSDQEYAVILNPYDDEIGGYRMGDRKVLVGPLVLALHYNESIEGGSVKPVIVVDENQAVQLISIQDHEKPAGFMWQVKGPRKYIPSKYENVMRIVNSILINENEGIYVRNVVDSSMKLVVGPKAYLLDVDEELYEKPFSSSEKRALALRDAASSNATVIHLDKGEALCVLDYEKNAEKYILGPRHYILGPQEGVKVLPLSAGKPKVTNALKVAKLRLGPDFTSDIFQVRTKDNVQLQLHLTYKWQFLVGEDELNKLFSLNDFIGYACQSLCSGIREEAARFAFEEFHNRTVSIIRQALFKEHTVAFTETVLDSRTGHEVHKPASVKVSGVLFDEVKLLISEVDVKEIVPLNNEIAQLLNQTIKSNMTIVCKKMEQEANLDAQKGQVQSQAEIQRLRESLIDIENENFRLETVEKAKIDGQSMIEMARAQKISQEVKLQSKLAVDVETMAATIALLDGPMGSKYLELLRVQNFAEVKQHWYVSSDSKVDLGLSAAAVVASTASSTSS